MELGLTTTDVDGVPVVAASGEIDFATAPRLRDALLQPVMNGSPQIVADLSEVEFLDSTGLGVLVAVLKRARTLGGDLAVVVARERVRSVFELTGLDAAMTVAASREDALAALRGSPG
jgi:anti-sigma B factor antagonist